MKKLTIAILAFGMAGSPALADEHRSGGNCKKPAFIEVTENQGRHNLSIGTAQIIDVWASTRDVDTSDARIRVQLGSSHHTINADNSYAAVARALCRKKVGN